MREMRAALALTVGMLLTHAALAISPDEVAAMRAAALNDTFAWDIAEGLTTEIGPRPAGSSSEEKARTWAVAKLKALGFSNVHVEPFETTTWTRGEEQAEIVSPFPQRLVLTALGGSAATPPGDLTTQVVDFDSLEELQAAPASAVRGKIVFVSHRMQPTQDVENYRAFGVVRWEAPGIAAEKGAVAVLIRSIGTDYHRNPHTGTIQWQAGVHPIPAAALSLPDAEQLQRVIARGQPVTLRLRLVYHSGTGTSGNVVAEVPGSDPGAGTILIGGHLDSWDLGTGAVDDAVGVALTTAAARHVMLVGRPQRTIRVVWFGAEEVGLFGAKAYAKAHTGDSYAFLAEADDGAGRIWRCLTRIKPDAAAGMSRLSTALAPLGIFLTSSGEVSASDIMALATGATPIIELTHDMTQYFDIHHSPDDTLDKIDPGVLRHNVAAWTTMLAVLANDSAALGPVPSR
jgi:carboxypeptidase Q